MTNTELLRVKGKQCICGHEGEDHAANEPRVCKNISCDCYLFRAENPYSEFLLNIDQFIAEFEEWYDRMLWLFQNMPFLCGLNNTQLVFFYWKYVYPKWDPETEFLTPELQKAIEGDAKPEAITRGKRLVKEKHPELFEKFQNLQMWQAYKEEGYREGAIGMKEK